MPKKNVVKGKSCLFFVVTITVLIARANGALAQSKSKTSHQIDLLMKEKKLRTAVEKKIDSQLLQALREKQGKKMSRGVNLQPADVNADKNGNLQVDINADVTDSLINRIKRNGGLIIYPSKEYHTIRAEINLSMVEKIAAFPEVKFIAPAAQPQLNIPVKPGNKVKPGIDMPVNISAPKQTIL